jgi:hypothetical protein
MRSPKSPKAISVSGFQGPRAAAAKKLLNCAADDSPTSSTNPTTTSTTLNTQQAGKQQKDKSRTTKNSRELGEMQLKKKKLNTIYLSSFLFDELLISAFFHFSSSTGISSGTIFHSNMSLFFHHHRPLPNPHRRSSDPAPHQQA